MCLLIFFLFYLERIERILEGRLEGALESQLEVLEVLEGVLNENSKEDRQVVTYSNVSNEE
jgi:hypothetical protein